MGRQHALNFFIIFMSIEEKGLLDCYPFLILASDVAVSKQRSLGCLMLRLMDPPFCVGMGNHAPRSWFVTSQAVTPDTLH